LYGKPISLIFESCGGESFQFDDEYFLSVCTVAVAYPFASYFHKKKDF